MASVDHPICLTIEMLAHPGNPRKIQNLVKEIFKIWYRRLLSINKKKFSFFLEQFKSNF